MLVKKNWPLFFIGFFLFLALLTPFFLLLLKPKEKPKKPKVFVVAPSPEAIPINVTISNIFPHGFTVSWVSVKPGTESTSKTPLSTTVKIILTENQDIESEVKGISAFDIRGENFSGSTHYVEIKNLKPQTIYTFKIKSGPTIYSFKGDISAWIKNGSPKDTALIKTTKVVSNLSQPPSPQNPYGAYSLEPGAFLPCPDGSNNPPNTLCFRPNPLMISSPNKPGVIAYLIITRQGTVISSIISCLTESTGNCLVDLANLYDKDYYSYLPYNPATDKIDIWANGGDKGNIPPTKRSIPEVINDSCVSDPLHCNTPTLTPAVNTPVIKLRVNFRGVSSNLTNPPGLDYQNQRVKLLIKTPGEKNSIYKNNNVIIKTTTFSDKFYYETDSNHLVITNITPGIYNIFIKGPKHLQKKFKNQNLTMGIVNLNFTSRENVLNGGDLPLPLNGDFNNLAQDGKVNSQDYAFIVNNLNSVDPKILQVADLNLDGIINTGDTSVLAVTIGEKIDEDVE